MKKDEFDATLKKFQKLSKEQRIDIQKRERRAVIKEIKKKMYKNNRIEKYPIEINGREGTIMAIAVYRLEGLLSDVVNKYDDPSNWRAE